MPLTPASYADVRAAVAAELTRSGAGAAPTPLPSSPTVVQVPIRDNPWIDLRDAPYSVVANDPSPATVALNTAGINYAIARHSGTGATLMLPSGDIFVQEQAPGLRWCIRFGEGISRLHLTGQGRFSTTLVQLCQGRGGELNLLNIDGASFIELSSMGFRQDQILNPDPGQQNHMVAVYNLTLGGKTEHIRGRDLFFGRCIGDALRILANDPADHVVDVRFSDFLMVLDGVVRSEPPNGRFGARSGIAVQRGGTDCEFANFQISGAQNSAIDEEPSGGSSVRMCYRNFDVDNTRSRTGSAVSLGGSNGGDVAFDGRIHDGVIRGGALTMLGPTHGYRLERLRIETTAPMPSGQTEPLMVIRSSAGGHQDLVLHDLELRRTGTSAPGNSLDILNTGSHVSIRGLRVHQGVAGSPLAIDGSGRLTIDGYRLRYDGEKPAAFAGILLQAVQASADDVRISDVDIVSSTGKLQAAVHIDQRKPRTMARLKITGVRSAGSASHGVYMSVSISTSGFDATPEISGVSNGDDLVWTQADGNDNPTGLISPIIAGNRGEACTLVGEVEPEAVVAAHQGSVYILKQADTTRRFVKRSGTGNTGWREL